MQDGKDDGATAVAVPFDSQRKPRPGNLRRLLATNARLLQHIDAVLGEIDAHITREDGKKLDASAATVGVWRSHLMDVAYQLRGGVAS